MIKRRFKSLRQLVSKPRPTNSAEDMAKLTEVARVLAHASDKVHILAVSENGYVDEITGKEYTQESLERNRNANKDHLFWIVKQ